MKQSLATGFKWTALFLGIALIVYLFFGGSWDSAGQWVADRITATGSWIASWPFFQWLFNPVM